LQQWTNVCTNFSPKSGGVGDASPLSKKVGDAVPRVPAPLHPLHRSRIYGWHPRIALLLGSFCINGFPNPRVAVRDSRTIWSGTRDTFGAFSTPWCIVNFFWAVVIGDSQNGQGSYRPQTPPPVLPPRGYFKHGSFSCRYIRRNIIR